ncbi:unnamed protein product [Gadus morhua 'NCC']
MRQEIPDDDFLSETFLEASKAPGRIAEPWLLSESLLLPGDGPNAPGRTLSIHLSKELFGERKSKDLIYVTGTTLSLLFGYFCLTLTWRETFFQVSLEEVAANQEAQNKISKTMDFLCPLGRSIAKHPWLDLCLSTYTVKTDGGPNRVCYQVCQTSTTATPP